MRKELQEIEYIEQYLLGQLSPADKQAFESEMHSDPVFKQSVELQKSIMDRIEKNALLDIMNEEHIRRINGSSKWKWLKVFGISALSLSVIITAVFNYIGKEGEHEPQEVTTESINHETDYAYSLEDSLEDDSLMHGYITEVLDKTDIEIEPFQFIQSRLAIQPIVRKINAQKGADLRINEDGTIIHIPANSLKHPNGTLVKGEVEIQFKQYKTQGDILASNYPMTVAENQEKKHFNSGGMFEIWAYQKNSRVVIDKKKPFRVDLAGQKLPNAKYYYLNPNSDEWQKISDLNDWNTQELAISEDAPEQIQSEITLEPVKYELDLWNCEGCNAKKPLDLDDFETALKFGIERFENPPKAPVTIPHPYPVSLEETFLDNELTEQYHLLEGMDSRIKFVLDKETFKKNPIYNLKYNRKTNPELRYFRNTSFYVMDKETNLCEYFKQDIIDLRIIRLSDDEVFEFKFKTRNGEFDYVKLIPVHSKDKKRFLDKSKNKYKWKSYQKALTKKQGLFDAAMQAKIAEWEDKESDKITNWKISQENALSSLYRYSLIWGDTVMAKLNKADWVKYLDTNKSRLLPQLRNWKTGLAATEELRMKEIIDQEIEAKNAWIQSMHHAIQTPGLGGKLRGKSNQSFWLERKQLKEGDTKVSYSPSPVSEAMNNTNYGKIITGLVVENFGVYSCNQTYRLRNRVNVKPKYVDQMGRMIQNTSAIMVINRSINASLTYSPVVFSCSLDGENDFILFADNDEIYHFSHLNWRDLKDGNLHPCTIKMMNVSDFVKEVADVQKMLDLDQSYVNYINKVNSTWLP